eukprot:scaffold294371_cov23-Tisochrysis_lutea.AAC.1
MSAYLRQRHGRRQCWRALPPWPPARCEPHANARRAGQPASAHFELLTLLRVERLARHAIDDAEGANRMAVAHERAAGVVADVGRAEHERVVGEPTGMAQGSKQPLSAATPAAAASVATAHLVSSEASGTSKISGASGMIAWAQNAASLHVCLASRPLAALNHCRSVSTSETRQMGTSKWREPSEAIRSKASSKSVSSRWKSWSARMRAASYGCRGQKPGRNPAPGS